MITLRSAQAADLDTLARTWYERAVLAPRPPGTALLPDARVRWQAAAEGWLNAPDHCVLVAQADGQVAGFAAGRIVTGPVGYSPQQVGEVLNLALDGHVYHAGAGRLLVSGLCDWFRQHGATWACVFVPHASPVEQAFWRALHGELWNDTLWMTL